MKKYFNFILSFFCLLIFTQSFFLVANNHGCQTGSKTFFRTRSIIEDVSFFLGLNQYNYYRECFEDEDCCSRDGRIHFAVGGFLEKSRPNFGRFFFSGGVNTNEQPAANAVESIIYIKPQRKLAGAYFDFHQDFCFCDGLWWDIKTAIYQATHNLCAKERALGSVTTDDCTPLCFLSSDVLRFGKIPTSNLKKSGCDDIEMKLGYYPFNCNGYLGLYGSVIFPTARRPTATFLFEPLVGRGHWGAGIGANAARNIYKCDSTTLTILTDFSYQYLFKRNELRSLDFKQGQLTRFVLLNVQNGFAQAVPAINLTTLNLKVEPRGIINFWLACHLQYLKWHTEIGYNLWSRQSEKICFNKKCQTTDFDSLGFFDTNNNFVPLTLNNLDLSSTSHPRTLTNKIYLASSYDMDACNLINIGLGGSYEFSKNKNSMEQWAIWGNLETNF